MSGDPSEQDIFDHTFMNRSFILWTVAFVITAASAIYQRVTGPTYPLRGVAELNGRSFSYTLERSHGGNSNHVVELSPGDEVTGGILEWRLHGTSGGWQGVPMSRHSGTLSAELPHQPPAGKLDYRVILRLGDQALVLPEGPPATIRFKGEVPLTVLILHIAAMFGGMLASARAGIECLVREPQLKRLTDWAMVLLGVGGCLLGPLVQHYAFGEYWTGWPAGSDLTDNKTAVALIAWIAAAIALRRARSPRRWVLAAAVVTLVAFLIPHSLFGSEIERPAGDQRITVSFRSAENPLPLSA